MAHKNIHSVNIVLQLEYFSSWVPGWCPLNTAPQQNMINTSWKLKIPNYLQWGFQGTFDVFGWNFQSQLQFWQHCYLWVVKYVCVDCFVLFFHAALTNPDTVPCIFLVTSFFVRRPCRFWLLHIWLMMRKRINSHSSWKSGTPGTV